MSAFVKPRMDFHRTKYYNQPSIVLAETERLLNAKKKQHLNAIARNGNFFLSATVLVARFPPPKLTPLVTGLLSHPCSIHNDLFKVGFKIKRWAMCFCYIVVTQDKNTCRSPFFQFYFIKIDSRIFLKGFPLRCQYISVHFEEQPEMILIIMK